MKNFLILCIVCACVIPTQAQFLKKLKDKVNKSVDKKIDKATGTDKAQTAIEKKENAASDQYSDATENNEKPIFVDKAPGNGKMILKLKKDDRFWGGYIQLKSQPKKGDANANILDFVTVRVGSFYTAGEMSSYAIYFNGQRQENDSLNIPLRPTFMEYTINKTPYFSSAETKENFSPGPGVVVQIPKVSFTFKWDGKNYGPFEGSGEKMFVLKSMLDGKPTEKFYGFGTETSVGKNDKGKSQLSVNGIVQTEKKVLHIKDYAMTTLEPTYPEGLMAFAQGGKVQTFSNGKTVPIIKVQGVDFTLYEKEAKFFSKTYGTDSGHVVSIVKLKDITQADNTTEAYIDYTTKLTYPVNIIQKNLLVANNPAKSVLYQMHTLYYADGTKEAIDNVGDAQIIHFNGKDYILWFEMTKITDGHEMYVCQKELK